MGTELHMRIAFFDTHAFERAAFDAALKEVHQAHEIVYFDVPLNSQTASLARGFKVICPFANDRVDGGMLAGLLEFGLGLIALRSAGFNNIDLAAADRLKIPVVRVPAYSPYAVAEYALCLLLALNRKIHRSHARVREFNFSLEGLVGFDLHGKTMGIVGTGRIGSVFARICHGLEMKLFACDLLVQHELEERYKLTYLPFDELIEVVDVISLHVPLNDRTRHLVDVAAIRKMKRGVYIINTGRGALIDTKALIDGLKSGQIGGAGLDVYEEEEAIFFHDCSNEIVQDDLIARLTTFPNVLVTSHQAFLTTEALHNIAATTLENITAFELQQPLTNEVRYNARSR